MYTAPSGRRRCSGFRQQNRALLGVAAGWWAASIMARKDPEELETQGQAEDEPHADAEERPPRKKGKVSAAGGVVHGLGGPTQCAGLCQERGGTDGAEWQWRRWPPPGSTGATAPTPPAAPQGEAVGRGWHRSLEGGALQEGGQPHGHAGGELLRHPLPKVPRWAGAHMLWRQRQW